MVVAKVLAKAWQKNNVFPYACKCSTTPVMLLVVMLKDLVCQFNSCGIQNQKRQDDLTQDKIS